MRTVGIINARFRPIRAALVGLLSMSGMGCGSGAPEIPPELLEVEQSGGENYPAGPYGGEVGDTLGDLTFQGYIDPESDPTLEEIRLGDFYDPDGAKGIKLLLLNTAAAWCQPCQIEHGDLPDRVKAFEDRGLRVFSLLFQDPTGAPATEETLDTWVQIFDTNFAMALDPSYQMGLYGPAETPPLNLVVDPSDMTLIAKFIGNQDGPMWALIERELRARNQ